MSCFPNLYGIIHLDTALSIGRESRSIIIKRVSFFSLVFIAIKRLGFLVILSTHQRDLFFFSRFGSN